MSDKIGQKRKKRDEIDAKIIACDAEVRIRKMIQEYFKKARDLEAGTIDVNDNAALVQDPWRSV